MNLKGAGTGEQNRHRVVTLRECTAGWQEVGQRVSQGRSWQAAGEDREAGPCGWSVSLKVAGASREVQLEDGRTGFSQRDFKQWHC